MPDFSGNTTTSDTSAVYNNPVAIKSFNITNKTGGAVTVNAAILYGSTAVWITPLNKSLSAGEMYEDDKEILILPGRQIYILVSGGCDFHFTLANWNE